MCSNLFADTIIAYTFYYWTELKGLLREPRNPTSQPLNSSNADVMMMENVLDFLASDGRLYTKRNELNKHYHPPVGDYI